MEKQSPGDANRRLYAANIPRYYLFMALLGIAFGALIPIWMIYLLRQRGLTLIEATSVEATFYIAMTLAEVPTGVVADTFGRKISLLCGSALVSAGMALFASVATIPMLVLTYIILGVGQTFFSGAQDALLYESVKAAGQTEQYTKIAGRAGAVNLAGLALGNIVAGPLATIDLALPIILCALMYIALLGVTLTFKEPPGERKLERGGRRSYRRIVRDALALIRIRPSLSYAILYMTLVPAAFFVVQIYFLQPQALALSIPLVAMGVVALAVQIANMVGLARADQIQRRFGERRVMYYTPFFLILSLILIGVFQQLAALVFIALVGFLTGVIRPLILNVVQNEVQDDLRATVLSMQSLMFTAFQIVVVPTFGFVADHAGLPAVYFGLAGILGVFLAWLVAKGRMYFPRFAAVQP